MSRRKSYALAAWLAILVTMIALVSGLSAVQRAPVPKVKAGIEQSWDAILAHSVSAPLGPAVANFTVVEFGDFQCEPCGKSRKALEAMAARPSTNLYFVNRPIPEIHDSAVYAAEAALFAADHGKFWPMYDRLYLHQKALGPASVRRDVAAIGMDGTAFDAALAKRTYQEKVDESIAFCDGIGVTATPTVLVRDNRSGRIVAYATKKEEIAALSSRPTW